MASPPVYEFPQEWYSFARAKFRLQSRSQVATRTWLGGSSVYGPHAQLWIADFTMTEQRDPQRLQIGAFFSRLDGQAGLIRIGCPGRLKPWYDRNITATQQNFSDATQFSDGTGFESGYLPPDVYVATAASQGDKTIALAGFPVSTSGVLTRGDLIQIKPNGIPGNCPNLYEVMVGGASDTNGKIGVELRPRLRMGFAVGDQVALRYPSTVFRLTDDDQGAIEVTPPVIGNLGFSLVEALDQIP